MKEFRQLLFMFLTVGLIVGLSSCGDDDDDAAPTPTPTPTPSDPPTVTAPSSQSVEAGASVTLTFSVTTPGGYASSSVSADGGTATTDSEPEVGAASGEVEVTFTAGETAGAGSVTVTVTDNEGQDDDATAVISIGGAPVEETEIEVDANITSDVTWESGKIYILQDRIAVEDGVTLTIEAGVVVKGEAGSGANATALLIARGGTLMAMGTAESPIIFTSVADEIQPGEIVSPNLEPTVNNLWGGVIVLGRAPISADAEAVQIEGIPPSDQNGLYGGTDADDNSGVIQYISIRHGGTNIGEGNEINGLTLGGVGTGTVIENVEVVGNQDDGIECFGGTVDVSNVLIWGQGDDAYDMDQAYQGTVDNFIFIAGPESDHGMELDGPEGSATGSFTLTNGSLKGYNDGGTGGGEYIDFRSGVTCTISNCYFFNFSESSDVEFDNNGVSQNYLDGEIALTNLEFNVSHLSSGNTTVADIFVEKTGEGESALDIFTQNPLDASIVVATSSTVGADKSAFEGWTWADAAGELDDF